MKTVGLRALILLLLTPVVVLVTAAFGVFVYAEVQRAIDEGFNRKLKALSGGTAAFVDGEKHALYQQRRQLAALAAGQGELYGCDRERPHLLRIDQARGDASLALTLAAPCKSVAYASGRWWLLDTQDRLSQFDPVSGAISTFDELHELTGLAAHASDLLAWRGVEVLRWEPSERRFLTHGELGEPVAALVVASERGYAIAADRSRLLTLDARFQVQNSVLARGAEEPTRLDALTIDDDGTLWAAGDQLYRVDAATAQVDAGASHFAFVGGDASFYEPLVAAFQEIRRAAGLTYLYTQVYLGDGDIYYVLDGSEPGAVTTPGAADSAPEATRDGVERVQLFGVPYVSGIQKWEQWGLVKVAYVPIVNATGQVIAMAGADVDITVIRRKTREALFLVIGTGIAVFVLALAASFGAARALTRPVSELKDAALQIAAGDYDRSIRSPRVAELQPVATDLTTLAQRLVEEQAVVGLRRAQLQEQRDRGRLHGALEERLINAATHRLGVRGPRRISAIEQVREIAEYNNQGRFIAWFRPSSDSPLVASRTHATLLAAASAYDQAQPAMSIADQLLGLLKLDALVVHVVAFDARSRQLHVEGRGDLSLVIIEGGRAQRLGLAPGRSLQLTESQSCFIALAGYPVSSAADVKRALAAGTGYICSAVGPGTLELA